MVDSASKLTINEAIASEDAGDDCDAVWPIAGTGVHKVLPIETDGLNVEPLLTALTPDL